MVHEEEKFIRDAFKFLDHPGFLIRVANLLGRPVELAAKTLPAKHRQVIERATDAALRKGLTVVTGTLGRRRSAGTFARSEKKTRVLGRWHTAASFGVGAAGGFFGILSLPIELPVTTAIILRSVVSIAEEFGMDLSDPQTQLECLYILSLGSPRTDEDDAMSSAYWTSRAAFARLANEVASLRKTAPALVRLMTQIATRFEVVVSEKFIAEAVPVIGAIGGASINAAFTDYFSQAARYHFGIRALEKKHGRLTVESFYTNLKSGEVSVGEKAL